MDKEIKEKTNEKLYDTLKVLRGIAANINQIARATNMGVLMLYHLKNLK